jgi:hypothetical protein
MSEIINATSIPNHPLFRRSIDAACGWGSITFAVSLISFGFPQFVFSLLCRLRRLTLPSSILSARALPETSTQACIPLSFCFSRENGGFIEENEMLVSEVLFVIYPYAMKLRGFREDVREITMS